VRRARTLALLLAVAVGTIVTPSALAYWRGISSGSAATTLPAPIALTLTVGTPMTTLVPGASSDVALFLGNPNSSVVHVTTIAAAATTPIAVDAAHSGCTVASLSFSSQTNGGLGWNVPAKVGTTDGALSVDLASAISMTSSAPNACQGATITLSLIAQG
jgi:hypothetical protein